jgi:CDP-glucose 4,6-dehydratase
VRPEFWNDKRVFLTGHTGFKGSWLSLLLSRMGARVCGYALLPPTIPSLFKLASVESVIESVIGDIRDRARLEAELNRFAPDVVLHLAAQSVVLMSYEDPIETFTTNVIGTAQLLDVVRQLPGRCAVVNVTTDKVYENRGWVWGYRENDALGGRDPYSSSKACAELVASSYRHSFFRAGDAREQLVGLANARAGNVIGGGDWTPRQLVPEAIQAFSEGRPVVLRHPEAIRPWQHVLDCLSGYLTLAEALYGDPGRYADDWNFGPSDADMQPVSHVVEVLAQHWGVGQPWVPDPVAHPHEESELRLSSQKATRKLHWTPKLPLEQALTWTADWYRRLADGTNARDLCVEQIERYMAGPAARIAAGESR